MDKYLVDFLKNNVRAVEVEKSLKVPFKLVYSEYKSFLSSYRAVPLSYKKFRREFCEIMEFLECSEVVVDRYRGRWFVFNIQLVDRAQLKLLYEAFYKIQLK